MIQNCLSYLSTDGHWNMRASLTCQQVVQCAGVCVPGQGGQLTAVHFSTAMHVPCTQQSVDFNHTPILS